MQRMYRDIGDCNEAPGVAGEAISMELVSSRRFLYMIVHLYTLRLQMRIQS